jgi:alpha-methylacyl-CoA racemase
MSINTLLSGVRVLDLSQHVPGPFCTLYLAQMGAEVIKLEGPRGDPMRLMSPEVHQLINRGKQCISLDLRQAADVERLHRLVPNIDVLVESFRPGLMEELGCGYQQLRRLNEKLVYAAITGYGQTGPWAGRPSHDLNIRALSGELEQSGLRAGPPAPGNLQTAGLAGGSLHGVIGILAALFGARACGRGSLVDVSMLDASLALQLLPLAAVRSLGSALPRGLDFSSGLLPNYAVYECADGRHLAVAALEPKFFAQLCGLLGRPDLGETTPRPGKAYEALRAELAAVFKTRGRDEWAALLSPAGVCVSPVLRPEEALLQDHVEARGLVENLGGRPALGLPIRFSNGLRHTLDEAHQPGADNAEILGGKPCLQTETIA